METAADAGSTPASESIVAPETPVVETNKTPSLDEGLRDVWNKHNPDRETNGRFLAKNSTEQAAEAPQVKENADQTADAVVEQAKPAFDIPTSWSAEMKAKLASLPPEHAEVIKYAAQRDKEQGDAIARAGQQVKAFEPIGKVIEQFSHVFQKNGLQPHEGIARMMAVNEMLEANPEAAVREIAKAYGVNLQGNAEQNASPDNPRIAELEARLAKAESHLTAQQRQRINDDNAALAREIADFAKDKPHFEAVRKVMAGLMQSGAAESMKDAYEQAIYADPTIRQSLQADAQKAAEDKRKAEEAERLAKAKKAGAVNVKSSPSASNGPRTMDDDLRDIARRVYGTA